LIGFFFGKKTLSRFIKNQFIDQLVFFFEVRDPCLKFPSLIGKANWHGAQ